MSVQAKKREDGKSEYERLLGLEKGVIGGKLDYLDSLPNAPKKPIVPFPYGSEGAKPYGWFSK